MKHVKKHTQFDNEIIKRNTTKEFLYFVLFCFASLLLHSTAH